MFVDIHRTEMSNTEMSNLSINQLSLLSIVYIGCCCVLSVKSLFPEVPRILCVIITLKDKGWH